MNMTLDALRQHELVVVRRLSTGPLTEFELADEVAEHSGYTPDQAADVVGESLHELREKGLIWSGTLLNKRGQSIMAAALTKKWKRAGGVNPAPANALIGTGDWRPQRRPGGNRVKTPFWNGRTSGLLRSETPGSG